MDPIEAGKLLATAAAFDNRRPSKAANHAWAAALHDLPADPDCFAAVARFYTEPTRNGELDERRWIEPHHVRHYRAKIRRERLGDVPPAYTPVDPDEDGPTFVERRRAQIRAIADGALPTPKPYALTGGPHPTVAGALAGIGRQIPEEVRAELEAAGIGRQRGRWPELAVPCPLHACRALAGRPCRTSKGKRMTQGTHPSRRDAWLDATKVMAGEVPPEAS